MTEEKISDVVNGNRTTSYSMDAVGNRLSKSDSVDGTTSYVYDANDRLLTETKGSDVTSYGYDSNGNTQSKTKGTDVTLYAWNDQGRLVGVQNPNGDAVSYQYNENGIRVSSTINGVKTSYLLDANRNYAQVLEEYDNSGTKVTYVHGIDLISQNRSEAKSFYLVDGLGSTRALTNANGVVTDKYIYDAYGNVLSSIGTTQNSYLYTGEQFDAGAGQYYLRDRYYNQAIGRFTRSDTWDGSFNNPLSLNKYLYANGSAVNFTDPSGLQGQPPQLSRGRRAHELIGRDFYSRISNPTPSQRDYDYRANEYLTILKVLRTQNPSLPFGSIGFNGKRVDLVDYENWKYYEVKPFNRYFEGLGQVLEYYFYLNYAHGQTRINGMNPWNYGSSDDYIPTFAQPFSPTEVLITYAPITGVIPYLILQPNQSSSPYAAYEDDDQTDQSNANQSIRFATHAIYGGIAALTAALVAQVYLASYTARYGF